MFSDGNSFSVCLLPKMVTEVPSLPGSPCGPCAPCGPGVSSISFIAFSRYVKSIFIDLPLTVKAELLTFTSSIILG